MNDWFRLKIISSRVPVWLLLGVLISACAAQTTAPSAPVNQTQTAVTGIWSKATIPFKATSVIATGEVFWICGENEVIASSSDWGNSWVVRHQAPGGATLLNISFANENVGHAAGTKGRLLSTVDGGKTWGVQKAAYDDVWAFSFSDALNGIAGA
jgi:photosystem II stability/assembly factor-like uncharacterized protein